MGTFDLQSGQGTRWRAAAWMSTAAMLAACGGGGGGGGDGVPAGHTVGGSVASLTSAGLVLENQRGDRLTLAAGATSFRFDALLAAGAAYSVRVAAHPASQDCAVANGSGTMGSSDVSSIAVSCGAMAPLALLSATPAEAAQDVPRGVRPRLEFSRPLDAATVNTGATILEQVSILAPLTVPVAATHQNGVLDLVPNRLLPLTRHTLVTGSALRGARGELLPTPLNRSFVTADGAWAGAIDALGSAGRDGDSAASMAVDDAGNAVAVWRDGAAEAGKLMARRFDAALGQWQAPIELAAAVSDVGAPQVAMDASGNAVVAWHSNDAVTTPMTRRFARQGGQWEAVQALSVAAGVASSEVQLAVSRGGRAFAAWRTSDERVWLSHASTGQALAWQAPVAMDEGSANVRQSGVRLAVFEAGAGQALVVWGQRPAGGPDIAVKARTYTVSGNPSLEPAVATLSTAGSLRAPQAVPAFDAQGQAHVVWLYETQEGTARFTDIVRRSRTVSQSSWQPVATVATAPSVALPEPRLALAAPGFGSAVDFSLWVRWAAYDSIANRHAIWGRKVPVEAGIDPPPSALTAWAAMPQPPAHRMVVDRAGNAMLAVAEPAFAGAALKTWRYAAQADRWSLDPESGLVGTLAGTGAGFGLTVNRSGTVHAWWDGFAPAGGGARPLQARRFD